MASITTEARNELTGLVIALFNAAPGADYLSAIVGAREAGASLESIALTLASKPAFQTVYPTFLTSEEFAARAVANLLPAETPEAAKAWAASWIEGQLNAGTDPALVLLQAAQALIATDNPNYAAAKAQLLNKIEVANYYSVTQEQPSTDLASLQAVLDGVDASAASVEAAKAAIDGNLDGETFILTKGADTFTGTTGADKFIAQNIEDVFTAFDQLDGGKGVDTLTIHTKGGINAGFPANAVVKNIEIININNEGAANYGPVDASVFQGATQINQNAFADDVTNLGAGTVAGFNEIAGGTLKVTAADSATSATVALNIEEGTKLAVDGAKLNTVTITGKVTDGADAGSDVTSLDLAVKVGKDVQALTLNSAVDTTLTATDNGKAITSIDAAASAGAITLAAANTVTSIKTGSGADNVELNTKFSATSKAAFVSTGAGNDKIKVTLTDGGNKGLTASIDAGDGDDEIDLADISNVAVKVLAGAGNDTVFLTEIGSVTEEDEIDGGAGTDLVVADGKTLVAEDYILLDEVLVNFEGIRFVTNKASVEADRMAKYKIFEFKSDAGGANEVTGVANDQQLFTEADLDATALGYKAGTPTTYAGTLDITSNVNVGDAITVTAKAESVVLTITPTTDEDGNSDTGSTTLAGDVKTATVVLNATVDKAGTAQETGVVVINNTATLDKLATLTISGNGEVQVTNASGKALATVDASGLNSADVKGAQAVGLVYTSANDKVAETIKLGGGKDTVTLTGSTKSVTDTITGLTLVADKGDPTKVDAAKSDDLTITGINTFVKTTVTGGSLNLALTVAATSADGDHLVFQYNGNTYIYADVGSTANEVDDNDVLVKLTGLIDLDLLVDALNT